MIKRIIFTLSTILIFGITGCDSETSYEITKMTLEENEKSNPTSFLSSDGTYRKNLLGEWVLEGTISNSAKIATFKDVVLEIHFYSKTKTHLGTEKKAIYEYFPAGKKKFFKIKTAGYQGTKTIGWKIINASPTD